MSTVLFALMAYAQVANQIKLNDFKLTVGDDLRTQSWDEEDFGAVGNENKSVNVWKWIMLLYLSAFSFSVMDTIIYWTVVILDINTDEVELAAG